MTYKELIALACQQAGAANGEQLAESLAPTVFRDYAAGAAGDARRRSLLTRAVEVTFADGAAELGEEVLTSYRCESALYDPADTSQLYALVEGWSDFVSDYETRVGRYHVSDGGAIHVVEPGAAYEDGAGLSGDLTLRIARVPQVPAAAADEVDVRAEVAVELAAALAAALQGGAGGAE